MRRVTRKVPNVFALKEESHEPRDLCSRISGGLGTSGSQGISVLGRDKLTVERSGKSWPGPHHCTELTVYRPVFGPA
jgi:hypothetical protein